MIGQLTLRNTGKKRLVFYIILIIALLTISGVFFDYAYRWWIRGNSKISVEDSYFHLGSDGRYIKMQVKSIGNIGVDITSIYVNGTRVSTFSLNKTHLDPEDKAEVSIAYYWLRGKKYVIKVVTQHGTYGEIVTQAPTFASQIDSGIQLIDKVYFYDNYTGPFKLRFTYTANLTGYSWVRTTVFIQKSFQKSNRSIYIFRDTQYMPLETLKIIDSFVAMAERYGLTVSKVDWEGLSELVEKSPRSILILPNPLMDGTGKNIFNAAPSCLVDFDEDGWIAEHSSYGQSVLYDWQREKGLILVSFGNTRTPLDNIIAKNGSSYARREPGFGEFYLANLPPSFYGWGYNYVALTKVGENLDLHSWSGWWQLSENTLMDSVGREGYYIYGYVVNPHAKNWVQPVFVKLGRGGWLYCGENLETSPVALASDLLMLISHAPWDSEWLGSTSWNYDSLSVFHQINGGTYTMKDFIYTSWMMNLSVSDICVRMITLAYELDRDQNVFFEKMMNFTLPSEK